MEATLTDYRMAHLAPSAVAAAALAFAMRVLDANRSSSTVSSLWTPTLAFYTAYTAAEVSSVVSQVADVVARATDIVDGKQQQQAKDNHGQFWPHSFQSTILSVI